MSGNNGQMKEPVKEKLFDLVYSLNVAEKSVAIKHDTNEEPYIPPAESINFYLLIADGPDTRMLYVQSELEGTEALKPMGFNNAVKRITPRGLGSKMKDRTKLSMYTSGHEEEIIEAISEYFKEHYKARA